MRKFMLLCVVMFGQTAQALVPECALTDAPIFAPAHPSASDRIRYGVALHPVRVYYTPYFAHSKVTIESGYQINKVSIDLLLSTTQLTLPGYEVVPVTYDFPFYGSIDPLPPGIYSATAVVRILDQVSGHDDIRELCPARDPVNLVVAAAPGPTVVAPVVEFYNATLDHYFITQNVAEIALLDAGGAWRRTGESFLAYVAGMSDGRGRAVARYYGVPEAGLDSHFYSWNVGELARISLPWMRETTNAFEIEVPDWPSAKCPSGTLPVYRLWNGRTDSAHRYTTNLGLKQAMVAQQGYVAEGYGSGAVSMCAPQFIGP